MPNSEAIKMKEKLRKLLKYGVYLGLASIMVVANFGCKPKFEGKKLKVMNWNLQAFGESKARNETLLNSYVGVMTNADIIFIQEIRDEKNLAFEKLCAKMPGYDHTISSRAGRSVSKEQYGIIFRKGIALNRLEDFNPTLAGDFERPPIRVEFICGSYTVNVYNVHTKPENTRQELRNLEAITTNAGNVFIIGDLNASGSYFNHKNERVFENWFWAIRDSDDTTVARSINAYDRVIMNSDAQREFLSYGIETNTTRSQSDHHPVWVEIAAEER